MSKMVWFRREKLGLASARGPSYWLNNDATAKVKRRMGGYIGVHAGYIRNDMLHRMEFDNEKDWLIRWGCTSRTENIDLDRQLNKSHAISEVGYKRDFRIKCRKELYEYTPLTAINNNEVEWFFAIYPEKQMVVRPAKHAQGKHVFLVGSSDEFAACLRDNARVLAAGWYASEYIHKVSEYRYYVVEGRIVSVAEKIPENPDAIAWNVAQGGEFKVTRWDDWNLDGAKAAIEAFDITELDFCGVDIMFDKEGHPYVIEINSAPSLPLHENGKVSYRQVCMAKSFLWIAVHGKGAVTPVQQYDGWRDVIHPALWRPKEERGDFEEQVKERMNLPMVA